MLLSQLAPLPIAARTSQQLLTAYSEAGRYYHTLQHVAHMLAGLQQHKNCLSALEERALELAIWFHDCVYDTTSSEVGGNERGSIAVWQAFAEHMVSLIYFFSFCFFITVV